MTPKASPDKPRWFCLDIKLRQVFDRPITLAAIKATQALESMVLRKQSRLSVQPVTEQQFATLMQLHNLAQ